MKLVFICGAGLVSGKERQTLNLMSALKKRGHDVFCVMSSWSSGDFDVFLRAANIPYARMRVGFISKSLNWPAIRMSLHQLIYVPSLWKDYRRLIRTFRPDVVVHTNFHHLFLLLPVLGNTKQVFHVHDFFSPGRFMKQLFRLFDKHVQIFIGVSRFICDSLPVLGVSPGKIKLVYNGVIIEGSVRQERAKGEVVVGIVGQIAPWKGHDVLLKALAAVSNGGWTLQVIGEGNESYVASLRELAEKLGISSRVVFKGSVSGLVNIYRELDIVCVPSVKPESFGLTAIEPALFGIPVICAAAGALSEVVLDNQTGMVVAPGDVDALAAGLAKLISDPRERNRLGEQACESVKKRFSIGVTVGEFEKAMGETA